MTAPRHRELVSNLPRSSGLRGVRPQVVPDDAVATAIVLVSTEMCACGTTGGTGGGVFLLAAPAGAVDRGEAVGAHLRRVAAGLEQDVHGLRVALETSPLPGHRVGQTGCSGRFESNDGLEDGGVASQSGAAAGGGVPARASGCSRRPRRWCSRRPAPRIGLYPIVTLEKQLLILIGNLG